MKAWFARYGRFLLVPAAALALASLAGALFAPLAPPRAPASTTAWTAPALAAPPLASYAKTLAERGQWGAAELPPGAPTAKGPEAPLTRPDWKIVALASSGSTRVAMLQSGSNPPIEIDVGDRLPGGAIVKGIEPGGLQLLIDGKRRVLTLENR